MIPPLNKQRHERTRNASTGSDTAANALFWDFTFVDSR